MATITLESTLSQLYREYYLPVCLRGSGEANIEGYDLSLAYWGRFTGDPPLRQIGVETLAAYVTGLSALPGKGRLPTGQPEPMSVNTVRKHLRHLQAVLDRAGPRQPRMRDCLGLLRDVPWIKAPREKRRRPRRVAEEDLIALYFAFDAARHPQVDGVQPRAWWRALYSTICSTSVRIGQLMSAPGDAVEFRERMLVLPAEVNGKSFTDEYHPLHAVAIRDLLAIRGERRLLFGVPSWKTAKSQIYKELHRLQALAGVKREFAFHSVRRSVLTILAKISPTAAQMAAGHSSFRTTLRHYIAQDALAEAVEQLPLFESFG